MQIPIKLTEGGKIPTKATPGSNAYDLYASDYRIVGAGQTEIVPTGVWLGIPTGYVGLVCPRSGWAAKKSVTVGNAPGVIDSDYRGEIKVILTNHGGNSFAVNREDRIGQILFVKTEDVAFDVTDDLGNTERGTGGFGSTGT